jgi:hypothetical protein
MTACPTMIYEAHELLVLKCFSEPCGCVQQYDYIYCELVCPQLETLTSVG